MTPGLDLGARRRELAALNKAEQAGQRRRMALEDADTALDDVVELVRDGKLNIAQAALAAAISRTTIYRRLEQRTNGR